MSRAPIHPVVLCAAAMSMAASFLLTPGYSDAQTHSPSIKPLRMDSRGRPYPASAASFDCGRAATRVERLICADLSLAMLDGSVSEIYWLLMQRSSASGRDALQRTQRAWLARRDACGDTSCLENLYEQRNRQLRSALERRDRLLRAGVSRVGQCQMTRIDGIGPRLQEVEGERPLGTSVRFQNGVRQVSYLRERDVLRSRIGDRARVCLISIPRGCPPGDDRGRICNVVNLRTRAQWRLPDASHRCGGA